MPQAILFDLFETLVTESRRPPPGVSSLALEFGCERDTFRREWKARRPAVVTGRISLRQALADSVATLGHHVEEAALQRVCDARVRAKAEPFAHIEPPLATMIDSLRGRGLRLGVISNCMAEDVTAWPRCALARRFDCAVFSFDVGAAKPDPAIYAEGARRLDVDASHAWFVGDGADDELAGAARAGLRAFRALWFLKEWPHFRDEPSSVESVRTAGDFIGLVDRASD